MLLISIKINSCNVSASISPVELKYLDDLPALRAEHSLAPTAGMARNQAGPALYRFREVIVTREQEL
jgi:hypothetical protein